MAIVYQQQIAPGTAFAIWKIDESLETLHAQLPLNSDDEQALQLIHHDKRKLHWFAARVLLRTMLNTQAPIRCRADENGKPFLVDLPYQIAISHSFDYAAVMLSETQSVGIDIELMSAKIVALAPKFLSPAEQSFIDAEHPTEHLYACWCAKEAIFKLHGKRGVSLLNDIHLEPFVYANQGKLKAHLAVNNTTVAVSFEKMGDYMLAWAR